MISKEFFNNDFDALQEEDIAILLANELGIALRPHPIAVPCRLRFSKVYSFCSARELQAEQDRVKFCLKFNQRFSLL